MVENADYLFELEGLLLPLLGLADSDDDVAMYRHLDVSDRAALTGVLRDRLHEDFHHRPRDEQARLRAGLQAALRIPGYDFDRVLGRALLPMPVPAEGRAFFVALWEALFPNDHVPTIG